MKYKQVKLRNVNLKKKLNLTSLKCTLVCFLFTHFVKKENLRRISNTWNVKRSDERYQNTIAKFVERVVVSPNWYLIKAIVDQFNELSLWNKLIKDVEIQNVHRKLYCIMNLLTMSKIILQFVEVAERLLTFVWK